MERTDFFNHLFQHSYGLVELRAIDNGRIHRRTFSWDQFEKINKWIDQHQASNLYFGVATRDDHGGKKENIVHIPAVWCDVDYKDTPRNQLKDLYAKFPYKASIIVTSGAGVHFYFLLKEPLFKAAIPQVEDVNRRIARALGGDLNACDAARILRIPDTINHKYEHKPQVKVTQLNDYFYELGSFLDILPPVEGDYTKAPEGTEEYIKRALADYNKLLQCKFIKWCRDYPAKVAEPLWYACLSNVISIRPYGVTLCHEISKGYPGYSAKETNEKILQALNSSGPHTCSWIKAHGFDCSKECEANSPAGLMFDLEFENGTRDDKRIKISLI